MSTNNSSEEIELGALFSAIKGAFKKFLILVFRFFQFLFKSWIIILSLLLIGLILGYFWEQNVQPKKETVLIVQTNFESTNYIYNAVEQLNNRDFENEEDALDALLHIEIEPIVDYANIFEEFDVENRALVINFLENFQNEKGPYSSEAFIPQYKLHTIKILLGDDATQQDMEAVVAYLQNNPLLQDVKTVALENLEQRVEDNQQIINQIDNILESLVNNKNTSIPATSSMVLISEDNTQWDEILNFKKDLLTENEAIRENILKQQELLVVINKPRLVKASGILSNKLLLLPILLIGIYLIVAFLKRLYYRLSIMAATEN